MSQEAWQLVNVSSAHSHVSFTKNLKPGGYKVELKSGDKTIGFDEIYINNNSTIFCDGDIKLLCKVEDNKVSIFPW